MRKVLLATSALVAAASFATASNAAAPELTLSGSIDMRYVSNSADNVDSNGERPGSAFDQQNAPGATSIHFDVNAESDSGLSYGGRVDWRPVANSIDEIWIDLAGSWGTVVIGNDDGIGDSNVPSVGSVLVGSYGLDGSNTASSNKIGVAFAGQGSFGGTSDAAKITYITPDLSGFGAGVSLTANADLGTYKVQGAATGVDEFGSHTELGAWWAGDLSGSAVKVGVSHKMAEAESHLDNDLSSTEVGASVTFGDFSVAANYYDNGDGGIVSTSTADNGDGFGLGVSYSFGDAAVSVGYVSNEADDGAAGEDEYENLSLDVQYSLAEGLTTYAGVQFAESLDASVTGNGRTQEETMIVVGTTLSF